MGFLLRNWHLKLSAVLLATVLYSGLVFSDSFSESSIQVRIEQENVSSDVYVLSGDLGLVEVRYRTENELAASVVADSFRAGVDLSEYDLERAPEPQEVPIEVTAGEGIQILSVEPATVRVELDLVEVRTVPVEVDYGTVPEGLQVDDPILGVPEVEVRGPASVVSQVDRAMAFVTIGASGIDVNQPVDLVPVDVEEQPVGVGVIDVNPESVSVQIDVEAVETTVTVSVRPVIVGTPAPGFALESLTVMPSTVTLRGLPEVLEGIGDAATRPLSIDGVSADQEFDAELIVPEGARLVDADAPSVTVTATIVPSVSSRTFVVGIVCEGAGVNACLPDLDQLTVTLSGPGDALSGLTAAALTPVVDASGLAPGSYSLTPTISGLPEDVELLAIAPGSVAVTIVAPSTPPPTPTPAP
jgi:YbbR domain-containing protein